MSREGAEKERVSPLSLMNWLPRWKGSRAPTELGTQGPLSPHPSLQNISSVTDENWPPASLAFPPIGCQNIGGLSPAHSWPWAPPHPGAFASHSHSELPNHLMALLSSSWPGQPCVSRHSSSPVLSSPAVSLKLPLHPACSQQPPPCFQAKGSNLSKRDVF